VSFSVLASNLPFGSANNQFNFNSLSGIIVGIILTIAGIIVLIADQKHKQVLDTG
jgi:hypothetical protein